MKEMVIPPAMAPTLVILDPMPEPRQEHGLLDFGTGLKPGSNTPKRLLRKPNRLEAQVISDGDAEPAIQPFRRNGAAACHQATRQ